MSILDDKVILITGGTGSLGKAFIHKLFKDYKPKKVIVFSRDEFKQSLLSTEYPRVDYPIRFFVGDVRDKDRLYRAFDGVDFVLHAAALKQVPSCEYNPFEAIKTNIIGSSNVVEAAIDRGVTKVIAASTDKACLDYHSRVMLPDGTTESIAQIVKQKKHVEVLSFDNNHIINKKITGWYKNELRSRSMFSLNYVNNYNHVGYRKGVILTGNHLVLTNNGWKTVEDIICNEDLLVTSEKSPSALQYSFICGKLLGDADISGRGRGTLRIGQSLQRRDWVEKSHSILKNLSVLDIKVYKNSKKKNDYFSFRLHTSAFIKDLYEKFYPNKKKVVPIDLIDKYWNNYLIAAWYMDDGTLTHKNARLATHGFSHNDVLWLVNKLSFYGFECYLYEIKMTDKHPKYYEIRFTVEGTKKLFDAISPFILPCCRNKVFEYSQPYNTSLWDNIGASVPYLGIPIIKKISPPKRKVYCLDVEDTHNFIVNNIIVHNCAPVNLYGATKLAMERLFVAANAYSGGHQTSFSLVRYGNVVGSRGSVIPLFQEIWRKNQNVYPVTHPDMTRFWITLDAGVNLVLKAFESDIKGGIFIPKIPSMKILDLVKVFNPNPEINIIGIRPGEKIHEMLISEAEGSRTIWDEANKMYVILPELDANNPNLVPKGFVYTSNSNDIWLDLDLMKEVLFGFATSFALQSPNDITG